MTTEELRWLIGISITVLAAMLGMLVTAFRALSGKIERGNETMSKAMRDGDDALHERVNRVRDEYVKRIDLDGHLGRIDTTLREIREEQKDMNRQLMAALSAKHG